MLIDIINELHLIFFSIYITGKSILSTKRQPKRIIVHTYVVSHTFIVAQIYFISMRYVMRKERICFLLLKINKIFLKEKSYYIYF